MKKLILDGRMIGKTGHGISKYVEGLATHFADRDPLTQSLLAAMKLGSISELEVLVLIRPDCPSHSPVRQWKTIELDLSCYHPKSWVAVPRLLKQENAELFFNPTFASYPSLPCGFVQTVHDLNHLYFGGPPHKLYYALLLRNSLKKATRIFTVSQAMRSEIAAWAGIAQEKIEVFYNQFDSPTLISETEAVQCLAQFGLKKRAFFFCVTNTKPHKNLDFLLEAYVCYRKNSVAPTPAGQVWANLFVRNQQKVHSDLKLPLVLTVAPSELSALHASEGVQALGGVDDRTLAALYQECAGFYFPSRYEGFGRPPVEAAKAGVNFIAVSDIPVHHEAENLAQAQFHFAAV